jgi:hypothetical protein
MKKIIVFIGSLLFIAIIAFNVSIGNSKKANDICLSNTEALACYTLEYNGTYMHDCCPPWDYICFSLGSLPGAWEHN